MSTLRLLLRNEWLKTRKRPVFYVTLGLFVFIDLLAFGYSLRESLGAEQGEFMLPRQWPRILGDSSSLPILFAGIVVVLLVASEFPWRTARQNVIDGLSREEWYWGKAAIASVVALLFCAIHVGLGGGLAWIGTPADATGLVSGNHLAAIGGLLVSAVGLAVGALLVASLVRRSGGAMAIWLFYVVAAEDMIRVGVGALSEAARPYLAHLPVRSFERVGEYLMYDADALARATELSASQGWPVPEVGEPGSALAVAAAWIAALALIGWAAFRRRDL